MTEHDGGRVPGEARPLWFATGSGKTATFISLARAYIQSLPDEMDLELLDLNVSPAIAEAWQEIFEPTADAVQRLGKLIEVSSVTVSGSESVRPENVNRTLAKAARKGVAGLSPVQLLIVVLVWLLAFGAPLIQQTLPPEAQSVVMGDVGTTGLALAITTLIIQQRKR